MLDLEIEYSRGLIFQMHLNSNARKFPAFEINRIFEIFQREVHCIERTLQDSRLGFSESGKSSLLGTMWLSGILHLLQIW